jgi:hypothetical protein
MKYVIRRVSDNTYLKVIKMAELENCEWSIDINEAKEVRINFTEAFCRRFKEEEFEIIEKI